MPRGGTAGGSKKSSSITFNKPSEPSFIRKIKEQVGYKEAVSIDAKYDHQDFDEDGSDKEDELPTVVVLKDGDLTAEQFEEEKAKQVKDEEESGPADGRILFKKPTATKRENVKEEKEKKTKKQKTEKKLLSFDEDNEDE